MKPLLEVKNLTVVFGENGEEKKILTDISFTLNEKETLGVVGESGSGKSITAMSIMNLISTPPLKKISGEIIYNNENIINLSNKKMQKIRGKEISYIFQEPMTALNPVFTIGNQIIETIRAHKKISKKEAKKEAIELLGEVRIPSPKERMKNYPHELSGGMRQRAMIAMALSSNPKIVIADEPTTALDVTVQAQILELLKDLIEKRNMSVIFITHDLGVIAETADTVLVIQNGKKVEYQSVDEIFHNPVHSYTKGLLDLIP